MTSSKVLGSSQVATGEAECARTQTEHCASSIELACWCVAKANAEHSTTNRHSHAIRFEADRIVVPHNRVNRLYTETEMLRNWGRKQSRSGTPSAQQGRSI